MKKILLAASVAALLMVGCNNKNNAPGQVSGNDSVVSVSSQVAYINLDSLIGNYKMYIDLRAAYEAKAKKADTELTSRGRSLERDIADYQEKVQKGLVTRSQAQTIEEGLNTKQQSFMQHRERVMGEMAEEEQVMLNQIQHSIIEFLKEFNSDHRYGMILSTTAAGPILNADPALDLTNVVLSGLNKKYTESKPLETKSAETK